MDWALIAQIGVAAGTWALALFTLWFVRGQLSIAKKQREVQLYLELRKEFDGILLPARENLQANYWIADLTKRLARG